MLERLSGTLARVVEHLGSHDTQTWNLLEHAVEPGTRLVVALVSPLPERWAGIVLIILGVGLILVAITRLAAALRTVLVGKARQLLHASVGKGPIAGILSGTAVTVLVQSSSTTTSLMVPLAGSGVFGLREVYPFTLGANIGTTITALLAATAITDGNTETALQIALAHFLYNLLGVAVIYGVPWLRALPLRGAQWIAHLGTERKALAIVYTSRCSSSFQGSWP